MRAWSKLFEDVAKFGALPPDERRFLLGALALGPVVRGMFARARFEAALKVLAAAPRIPPMRRDGMRPIAVERGESLVRAAFRARGDEGCLPRSIVQFVLHRRFGPPPRLVIGVRREADRDLRAHAWVEAAGGPRRDLGFSPILGFSDAGGVERPGETEEQP